MAIEHGSVTATLGTSHIFCLVHCFGAVAGASAIFFGADLLDQVIVALLLLGQETEDVDVIRGGGQTKGSLVGLFVVPELVEGQLAQFSPLL